MDLVEIRRCIWNICCQDQPLRQNFLRSNNFWIGMRNRLNSKKPAQLSNKLSLIERAEKIEQYIQVIPKYIGPVHEDSRQWKLLEEYQQNNSSIEIWGELGYGAFGTAYLAIDKTRERFVCLKVIDINEVKRHALDLDISKRVHYERKLQEVFHDKIIEIYDLFETKDFYVFQLEYFPGVNLVVGWQEIIDWDLESKVLLLKRILEGIKCLHLFGWIHRDIHASNILADLAGNGNVKVIDFGLSKKLDEQERYIHSIPGYGHSDSHPPEVRAGNVDPGLGEAIDIWAFGSLAYKLLAGVRDPYEVVTSDKTEDLFPVELDQTSREELSKSLASDPKTRPSARQIHRALRSWCLTQFRKYLYEQSHHYRRLLEAHMEYLSSIQTNPTEIKVTTENGDASIYFQEGQLIEASYGQMKGWEVLEELEDEVKLLHGVDLQTSVASPPSPNSQLENFQVTGFLLEQANNNDVLRNYRSQIIDLTKRCLGISRDEVCCSAGEKCEHSQNGRPKTWSFDNLLYSTNVYLYGRNRHQLAPWCRECIVQDAIHRKDSGRRLALNYNGYAVSYLDQNLCAQFYLGFMHNEARNFILYVRPGHIKDKLWKSILTRIKRGYDILGNYPSRYFINFHKFHPIKQDEEKFAILSMEYFPGINLRQLLNSGLTIPDEVKTMILFDLARALQILHDKGVVHRNINPSSILLGVNGQVKLGDFSLCRYDPNSPSDEDHYQVTVNITQQHPTGVLLYSSPEYVEDMANVTTQSDIWSWGVVAYEILTGVSPFKRGTPIQGLRAIKREDPEITPLAKPYRTLIREALIKEKDQRVITIEDIIAELRKLLYPE